jgi:hypothetical protein
VIFTRAISTVVPPVITTRDGDESHGGQGTAALWRRACDERSKDHGLGEAHMATPFSPTPAAR